jgi:hypothetical protein
MNGKVLALMIARVLLKNFHRNLRRWKVYIERYIKIDKKKSNLVVATVGYLLQQLGQSNPREINCYNRCKIYYNGYERN